MNYSYKKIARLVIPSIIMMLATSLYTIVDGLFISNYSGKTSFAAVNLMMPLLMISGSIGIMIGSGGNALISKLLGEGNKEEANKVFSMIIELMIIIGVIFTIILEVFPEQLAKCFHAEGQLLDDAVFYTRIFAITQIFFVIQTAFLTLYPTVGKGRFGLIITLLCGGLNIIGDFLLVGVFKQGLAGAAIASIVSQFIGGIIPLIYFTFIHRNTDLKFTPCAMQLNHIFKVLSNGISEFISNISISVVNIVFNAQLMRLLGEDGVSAYGTIMYLAFTFSTIYSGYTIGMAPSIAFNYGAREFDNNKIIFKKSILIISILSILMLAASEGLAYPLSYIYTGYDEALFNLTIKAFRIYSFSYLFCGFNIFASGLFTAYNDGITSGIISFMRTFVFQIIFVLLLPLLFGVNGIWASIVLSEIISLSFSLFFIVNKKSKYQYV